MFRIGWSRVEARLIDQVLVRRDAFQSEMGGRTPFQVWDYLVELPDGERLAIREKSFEVQLPEVGGTVPVLVNRRRTKAVFDMDDPEISTRVIQKRREAARKQRDQEKRERFERKLRE